MLAMKKPEFGGPELFEERNVERPEAGPGEVLVWVVAAGTNPIDAKLRANGSFAGLEPPVPKIRRLSKYWAPTSS